MVKGSKQTEETKLLLSTIAKKRTITKETRQKQGTGKLRQFCKYGHDTHKVGRSRGDRGTCRMCHCIHTATKRGFVFELTDDKFVELMNSACVYNCSECNATGIDQIIAGKGYTMDNVQPMCGWHNAMKLAHPTSKFESLCAAVLNVRPRTTINDI